MTNRPIVTALAGILLAWPMPTQLAAAPLAPVPVAHSGPAGPEDARLPRQFWLVPSPLSNLEMRSYLYRPAGNGPFPLAVINHGSEEDAGGRRAMGMPDFPALTAWLVARGYAVLVPQRPGHGATGGRYLESHGWCASPDYQGAGRAAASSIESAIQFMLKQRFIRPGGVLVLGNSAGGWGALALAGKNPPAVAAVVNFSGGSGGRDRNRPNNNCAPDKLIAAAGDFGRTARVPTLWLYAENDSYFSPDLSRHMADAFSGAGGQVDYQLLPSVRGDGHALIATSGQEASWMRPLGNFLARLPRPSLAVSALLIYELTPSPTLRPGDLAPVVFAAGRNQGHGLAAPEDADNLSRIAIGSIVEFDVIRHFAGESCFRIACVNAPLQERVGSDQRASRLLCGSLCIDGVLELRIQHVTRRRGEVSRAERHVKPRL
ncbi:MAG TPA: dienelactone hydrolase family protein [Arsenicitalea sp.]|nr:dienelactone hydrolase family protein [Arsenicitalea sp.]